MAPDRDCLLPATRAVRAGVAEDAQYGAVIPPLHLSATFTFAAYAQKREYDYTRSGNPTRQHLATALAGLEEGETGLVTASGMAAVTLVLQLLRPGQRVVAAHDCYGGTHRALVHLAQRGAFALTVADLTDPDVVGRGFPADTRLVWAETPSNPLLRITDLAAVARAAHAAGALLVVDNTFLTPARQRPLAHGADLVVHSTTKYLNGHSDVVGGAVVAADPTLGEELGWWCNALGLAGAPFDSWLTLRGLRTLHPRLAAHEANAEAVAARLAGHDAVAAVYYPGLAGHPGHALARRQQEGFGGIVSATLRGGESAARRFLDGLRCFSLAESLGGVESLAAHPATMTHASMPPEARATAGIEPGLVRLSVGIEDPRDLLRDLDSALVRAGSGSGVEDLAGHPAGAS